MNKTIKKELAEKIHRIYYGNFSDLTIEHPFVEHDKNLQKELEKARKKKVALRRFLGSFDIKQRK